MKLNPADEAYYKFLKQQVDRAQDEAFRRDANRRAKIKLEMARVELSTFVKSKRSQGYHI